ncbi:MAG TPA: acylphosphatase [Acetobacteraceae bacterium]|nr:acylphosphatase [Acetobacteraceae bacterium]
MIAKRVVIKGAVQGVGFRDWMVARARLLGVDGWVRNRPDGAVEAVIAGDADAVEELLRACRRGPPAARVTSITDELADPPPGPGFVRR